MSILDNLSLEIDSTSGLKMQGSLYYLDRWMGSGPCILRPLIQTEKCGLKLKAVLKWRDTYIGNIWKVSVMAGRKIEGLKIEGSLKKEQS